jgi:hypothetical protein
LAIAWEHPDHAVDKFTKAWRVARVRDDAAAIADLGFDSGGCAITVAFACSSFLKCRCFESRAYGALQRKLLAILNAEDRVFETYTLVADAFDVKADENGLPRISTAQMSAARRALRGLVRDGAVIDLGRHYPNTRRHWCSKRTELLYEIQYKREAVEALIRRGQVDEVARLSQQMGPFFERAREVGIEPYAEAMKPKKPKVSAASRGDRIGSQEHRLDLSSNRGGVAARRPDFLRPKKGGDHIAATAWPAGGGGVVTSGGAMAQLFRAIPQAANASHEEDKKVRSSKRICTLVGCLSTLAA